MEKKEIIQEFFDNLKKALSITSFYSKEHPLFLKAVEDFKGRVEHTFNFINPIQISVAVDHLLFDDLKLSSPVHAEMAKKMHLRKIKSIKIKQGITFEELTFFLNRISVPIKDFIKNGGAFIKENMAHLLIEEIDYWELLKTEGGKHYKDIWEYLLNEAIHTDDYSKMMQLSNSFGEMLRHFTVPEILENNELYENIKQFLSCLKDKNKERFSQCAIDIARCIFNIVNVSLDLDPGKIRALFGAFTDTEFAGILTNEILSDDESDSFSFDLFFRFVDEPRQGSVASLTVKSLRGKPLWDKKKIQNKIEKLLGAADKYHFSEVYQNAFALFLKDLSSGRVLSFDRDLAYGNYRLMLLNLLAQAKTKDSLEAIIKEISKELKNIIQNLDLTYLGLLVEIAKKKKTECPQLKLLFEKLDSQVANFVESHAWDEQLPEGFEYLADYPESSVLGMGVYLTKIFDENKVNAIAVKLFLKLFPDGLSLFLKNLEKKYSDIEFNEELIKSLEALDIALTSNILKQIYSVSNNYIKSEVLTAMQEMDKLDKGFLFSILQGDDIFLKQKALLILAKDKAAKKEALDSLFLIDGPWGTKNKILLDNIILVEKAGLTESKDYLVAISKKHFFWNWNIKRKAQEVLKRWNL